jgi:hypothetical protein
MERRKIVYQEDGTYQVLKPKDETRWHERGQKKSLHAISDLIEKGEFEFVMSENIREQIRDYRDYRREQTLKYSNLESKLI